VGSGRFDGVGLAGVAAFQEPVQVVAGGRPRERLSMLLVVRLEREDSVGDAPPGRGSR
jgi:hypothetical protein